MTLLPPLLRRHTPLRYIRHFAIAAMLSPLRCRYCSDTTPFSDAAADAAAAIEVSLPTLFQRASLLRYNMSRRCWPLSFRHFRQRFRCCRHFAIDAATPSLMRHYAAFMPFITMIRWLSSILRHFHYFIYVIYAADAAIILRLLRCLLRHYAAS